MHLSPGSHASTFGGNALGCAVALAALREIQAVLPRASAVAERLRGRLDALRSGGRVELVRGRGMLLGVKVHGVAAPDVVVEARARGLLANAIGDEVVRLAPPLTLSEGEADEMARRLGDAIAAAPSKG
jgi:acetylornithine/N-succinyldiaminopimelate aminotransferase